MEKIRAHSRLMSLALAALVLSSLSSCAGPGGAGGWDMPTDQRLELVQATVDLARGELAEYLARGIDDGNGGTIDQPNAANVLATYDVAAGILAAAYADYLDDGQLLGRAGVEQAAAVIRKVYGEYISRDDELSPADFERKIRRAQYLTTLVLALPWED